MSRGDRGERPKANLAAWLAAAFGAALIIGGIAFGLFQQARYQESADHNAADYAKHAANKIGQSCVGLSAVKTTNCLEKEQTEYQLATRDNRRDYADLVAQRKSALWTFIMGAAALIGMGLSVVGVVLIKKTFDAAREGNEIAATLRSASFAPMLMSPKSRQSDLRLVKPLGLRSRLPTTAKLQPMM